MLVLGLSFSVHAWNPDKDGAQIYILKKPSMFISFPNDMFVFTREMDSKSPVLERFGYTKEELISEFEKNDTYLRAWSSDLSYGIYIYMNQTDNQDLADYSDREFNNLKEILEEDFEEDGAHVTGMTDFYSGTTRFIRTSYYMDDEDPLYGIECVTFNGGERIFIDLISFDGPVSSTAESLFDDILENMTIMLSFDFMFSSRTSSSKASSVPSSKTTTSTVTSSKAAVSSSTVTYPAPSTPSTMTAAQAYLHKYGRISFWSILLTIIIFTAPIVIYRYTNIKHAVEPKKALMITIFYGLVGAAVTVFLAVFSDIGLACVGVVMILSFVNYHMLVKGRKQPAPDWQDETMIQIEQTMEWNGQNTTVQEEKAAEESVSPEIPESEIKPEVDKTTESVKEQGSPENAETPQFCYNCGAKLRLESKFCPKCGAKVEKLGDE